jgi:LEA14-like dessication related protein
LAHKLMYSMKHLNIYLLLIVSLVVFSCGRFSDIIVGDVSGVNIKGFEENALVVELNVPIDNPTIHKIRLNKFDAKVYMNNQYLGKANNKFPLVLNSKSSQVYTLVLEIRLANVFGTAMNIMTIRKGQKVKFRIDGSLSARTFLVCKKIEISESREVTF